MAIVVVECPNCRGRGTSSTGRGLAIEVFTCPTCSGKGFCQARLWTEADQTRVIQEALAQAEKERLREERRQAARERRNPKTHWCEEPLPPGWATRYSSCKHGHLPFRGNVRIARTKSRLFRVEVRNDEAQAWEAYRTVRADGNARILYTKVLSKAYALAETLYEPSPEEIAEARKAEEFQAWLDEHAEGCKAKPHPSKYHPQKSLFDWVTWVLENRPDPVPLVKSRVTRALGLVPEHPLPSPPAGNVADSLVAAMQNGSETGLTDSSAALASAVGEGA